MTDLLDPPPLATERVQARRRDHDPLPSGHARVLPVSPGIRVVLGVLLGAAGIIHLVMIPSHFGLSALEGLLFAFAGWLQIGLAAAVVARPARGLLAAAVAANLVFLGAWGFSRIWGLPFGAHAWHAEASGIVDLTVVGFEAAFVLIAAVALVRPATASSWSRAGGALSPIVAVAVVVLTTAALTSSDALDHANQSHGTHLAAGDEGEVAGTEHADAGAHDHNDGVLAEDDKGFSALDNGHQHDDDVIDLSNDEASRLAAQLARTAALVERYPTLADAEAGGYRRAGPFSPGLGTHMMPPYDKITAISEDGLIDTQEEIESAFLIYDGITGDAPIAGFMYMAYGLDDAPEGFVGPNDHWHYHTNTCVVFNDDGTVDAPLGADREATQEQCDTYGGALIENTGYMVHVWTVPGYENPMGTFAELHPALTCPDGTYYTIDTEDEDIGTVATLCRT